jgi:hypothetical protein
LLLLIIISNFLPTLNIFAGGGAHTFGVGVVAVDKAIFFDASDRNTVLGLTAFAAIGDDTLILNDAVNSFPDSLFYLILVALSIRSRSISYCFMFPKDRHVKIISNY